jgi:hypothetical protein
MKYSQEYLLQKPPYLAKDLSVWSYVVNKLTDNGSVEISIGSVIKYYVTKVKYLQNKK